MWQCRGPLQVQGLFFFSPCPKFYLYSAHVCMSLCLMSYDDPPSWGCIWHRARVLHPAWRVCSEKAWKKTWRSSGRHCSNHMPFPHSSLPRANSSIPEHLVGDKFWHGSGLIMASLFSCWGFTFLIPLSGYDLIFHAISTITTWVLPSKSLILWILNIYINVIALRSHNVYNYLSACLSMFVLFEKCVSMELKVSWLFVW